MKKIITVLALVLTTTAAHADGFHCSSTDGSLDVKVFNHVNPELGTRTGAVMVLSNPEVAYGSKTIARFQDVNLSSDGATYLANVDLRFSDSARKGELIAGTKLGYIDTIRLALDHNYNLPVEHGTSLRGWLDITKRDGDVISMNMDCVRYLKN